MLLKSILAVALTLLPLSVVPPVKVPALESQQQELIQASRGYLEACEAQAGVSGCSVSLVVVVHSSETPTDASSYIVLESPGFESKSEQSSNAPLPWGYSSQGKSRSKNNGQASNY